MPNPTRSVEIWHCPTRRFLSCRWCQPSQCTNASDTIAHRDSGLTESCSPSRKSTAPPMRRWSGFTSSSTWVERSVSPSKMASSTLRSQSYTIAAPPSPLAFQDLTSMPVAPDAPLQNIKSIPSVWYYWNSSRNCELCTWTLQSK